MVRKSIKRVILLVVMLFLGYGISLAVSKKAQDAMEVLKSTDTLARRRAAAELGRMRSSATIPALINVLGDEDAGVRASAADALGKLRDRRSVGGLIKLLRDKDRNVRISAIVALGFIKDIKSVKAIVDVMKKDSEKGVKISAAQVLGVLGDKGAVKPLITELSNDDKRVRAQAARSLGKIGAEEAVGPLIDVLDNNKESSRVRKYSIEALGEIKTAKSVKKLKAILKVDDQVMAVLAAVSLGKLGEDDGLDVVLAGVKSEDVKIRREAIMALSYIGVKNKAVEKAVKKALEDKDPRVRSRAEFVVKSLGIEIEEKPAK